MKFLALYALVLFAVNSQAQTINPYLGSNTGLMSLKGEGSEASKNGYLLGVKALGSVDMSYSVLDGSLGYQFTEVASERVKITTKSLYAEFEGRYKFTEKVQFGGSLKVDSGVDNTGAETVGHSTTTTHLFAKAVYQTRWENLPFRIEAGLGSSVNLSRNFGTAMIGIQVGFPMKKKSVITTVESKSDTVKLQMAKILFNSDSYSLGDISQERLAKLASYLKKTNQNWERVKISGHTDETGNDKYNLSLSQDRADAILKVLIVNGVSETKISSIGYGSRRPVDKDTLAQNRRIEIEFFGVKNRQELNSSIQKILKGS